MPELDPTIRDYYDRGLEAGRLTGGFPSGPLEFERTKEIISRYLSAPPRKIIDIGGGPGLYSAWLAERGDDVHLVDPVGLHVNQARSAHSRIKAEIGDARQLAHSDAAFDIALLLGPLYHLVGREDRLLALSEARRVVRPGGWVFAAAISRYAALFDLLVRADLLHDPEIFRLVEHVVETGVFHGQVSQLFTTAYFHLPAELAEEVSAAGFELKALLNIEGPGFLLHDFEARWADPVKRKTVLDAARLVEAKPELLSASSHILAVAQKR